VIALLGLVRSPVGIAACVALGLAISTAFCFRAWQNAREEVGEYRARLEQQAAQTETAVAANASNQTSITELEQRLRDMTAARQLEREQRDLALAAREREALAAREDAARLRRQLNAAWRSTSDCEALGRVDVAGVCPDVAARLRERAAGGRRNPDS
jgi:hypothetical protein